MHFEIIANWLKTTIPGILALGALGSIIAIFALKLMGNFVKKWVPVSRLLYKRHERSLGLKHGYTFATLKKNNNVMGMIVYFVFHSLRTFIALFCALISFQFFLLFLPVGLGRMLTLGTFCFALVIFLCLRWAYVEYRNIRAAYRVEIWPIMEKALEEKDKNVREGQPQTETTSK